MIDNRTDVIIFSGYQHEDHRLYFRRLSQTTQTDVLLGNLDNSDTSRVFLRPMTVQQRIKALNLRARMFADTMMAIQTPSDKHTLRGPRSLQVCYYGHLCVTILNVPMWWQKTEQSLIYILCVLICNVVNALCFFMNKLKDL